MIRQLNTLIQDHGGEKLATVEYDGEIIVGQCQQIAYVERLQFRPMRETRPVLIRREISQAKATADIQMAKVRYADGDRLETDPRDVRTGVKNELGQLKIGFGANEHVDEDRVVEYLTSGQIERLQMKELLVGAQMIQGRFGDMVPSKVEREKS